MQKIGAQFLAKRIANQIMAPPQAEESGEPRAPGETDSPTDDLHGQVFRDDEGQAVGRAYRVEVAVYVIADGYADRHDELKRCLAEPESRVFFRAAANRITDLIYAPDPNRPVNRVEGLRADEV